MSCKKAKFVTIHYSWKINVCVYSINNIGDIFVTGGVCPFTGAGYEGISSIYVEIF